MSTWRAYVNAFGIASSPNFCDQRMSLKVSFGVLSEISSFYRGHRAVSSADRFRASDGLTITSQAYNFPLKWFMIVVMWFLSAASSSVAVSDAFTHGGSWFPL